MSGSMKLNRRTAGTSLVEVLVVIVIFLIGILAIVQIFPGGLRVLSQSRSGAMSAQLGRAEIERLKGRADQLPEMILPVRYVNVNGRLNLVPDPERRARDLGLAGPQVNQAGIVFTGANEAIDYWPRASGPNNVRRIVGEGGKVPSPREVGLHYGGLMILQFGPIVNFDPAVGGQSPLGALTVYGDDLVRTVGTPDGGLYRPYEYFLSDPEGADATLHLPVTARYRLSVSVWANINGQPARVELIGRVVDAVTGPTGYAPIRIDDPSILFGEVTPGNLLGIELDSLRVARVFEPLPVAAAFSNDPYQFKVVDGQLGVLLFNPAGYNYFEYRGTGRLPLRARVDYDVLDWRVIKEEFRVTDLLPAQHRLALSSLMVLGNVGTDGRAFDGLPILIPNGGGGTVRRDFALVDLDTGGYYLEESATRNRRLIQVDKSLGLVTFTDADDNPVNGLTAELVLPGASAPIDVDISRRAVRALYQGNNEWAVQVLKAPSSYALTYDRPTTAKFYVGGSRAFYGTAPLGAEAATRIYFPQSDLGRKVVIDEIWYRDSNNTLRQISSANFVIRPPRPGLDLPCIDITEVAGDAVSFDFAEYGYAVRGVRGASVLVRTMWNGSRLNLTDSPAENVQRLERYGQGWRTQSTETFLQREDRQ
jgi:hypothetical protein